MTTTYVLVLLGLCFLVCALLLVSQSRQISHQRLRIEELERRAATSAPAASAPAISTPAISAAPTRAPAGAHPPMPPAQRRPTPGVRQDAAAPESPGRADTGPIPVVGARQDRRSPDRPATAPIGQVIDSWAENELRRFSYRSGHRPSDDT